MRIYRSTNKYWSVGYQYTTTSTEVTIRVFRDGAGEYKRHPEHNGKVFDSGVSVRESMQMAREYCIENGFLRELEYESAK